MLNNNNNNNNNNNAVNQTNISASLGKLFSVYALLFTFDASTLCLAHLGHLPFSQNMISEMLLTSLAVFVLYDQTFYVHVYALHSQITLKLYINAT